MKRFIIYVLHHEDSFRMYVGRSSSGLNRPKLHGSLGNKKRHPHFPVVKWIEKLHTEGKEYEIAVLEEYDSPEKLNEAEMFYISYFRSLGIPLLNCSDGGEGCTGTKHSVETKAKIGAVHRGKKVSSEAIEKMVRKKRGQKHSLESRTKISKSLLALGRKASESTKEAIRLANTGRKYSAETRAKISAARRSRPSVRHTAESKAKIAESNRRRAAKKRGL